MACSTDGCTKPVMFRYTWAGSDEAHICYDCAVYLKRVAIAIDYHIQMIPLTPKEIKDEERV